jgi:hypothetical protein
MLDGLTSGARGALLLLLVAAAFEVLGNAFFHSGLHRTAGLARVLPFLAGCAALVLYGMTVNLPGRISGKLLGGSIAFFFLLAQIVACLRFEEIPTPRILVAGSFILAGGAIMGWGGAFDTEQGQPE